MPKKSVFTEMTDSDIRDALLRFLDELHRTSKSAKTQEIGVRDLKTAMKERYGLRQEQIVHHLDYLVQKGWVRREAYQRQFVAKGGTVQPSEKIRFRISADGMDRIAGAVGIAAAPRYSGINIHNVNGVTVVGDGNAVKTQYVPAAEQLGELRKAILASHMPDDEKFSVATEVDRIQLELARPEPDRNLIGRAWEAIQGVATVGTLADLVARTAIALGPLLVRTL